MVPWLTPGVRLKLETCSAAHVLASNSLQHIVEHMGYIDVLVQSVGTGTCRSIGPFLGTAVFRIRVRQPVYSCWGCFPFTTALTSLTGEPGSSKKWQSLVNVSSSLMAAAAAAFDCDLGTLLGPLVTVTPRPAG